MAVLKTRKKLICPEYLAHALNGASCYAQSQLFTRGATKNDLGLTRITNIYFAYPPLIEQQVIVDYLDKTTAKIDHLIAKAGQAIGLMKERRTALISAAVTGKIDVRDDKSM